MALLLIKCCNWKKLGRHSRNNSSSYWKSWKQFVFSFQASLFSLWWLSQLQTQQSQSLFLPCKKKMLQNKVTYSEPLCAPGTWYENPFCCLSQTRKQGHKVDLGFICHRTVPEQHSRARHKNKPSSSFLLGAAQGASAQHTSLFPNRLEIPPAGTNQRCGCKISPPLLSPTPTQPFIGFYCSKALQIHSPGWQCRNSSCLCSAQLTQDARTSPWCPHATINTPWFCFLPSKTPFSLLK